MKLPFSPTPLFGALLSLFAGSAVAVDTSQWKCESCPFDAPGTQASVEVGAATLSGPAGRFGDYTGWRRQGAYLLLGTELSARGDDGLYGEVRATDLGLGSRSVQARGGREGSYDLRLGYAQIEHDQAQPVDIVSQRRRFDAGASLSLPAPWSLRVDFRHDERHGAQRTSASFFSTAAQLLAPLDDRNDQLDLTLGYADGPIYASLAYHGAVYSNSNEALVWANPFAAINGASSGQLARPPGNQFHQLAVSAAYELAPGWRASGEAAWGNMTQDAAFLPITTNATLSVPALPATSLNGKVYVYDGALRLSGTLTDHLKVYASYARSVRDNRSPRWVMPAVSTDVFVDPTEARASQSFDFTRDTARLSLDYRASGLLRASLGADGDERTRTLQEVVRTRETTGWAKIAARPHQALDLALKLARAERRPSTYGVASWISPPENPLLRKFNLAQRLRETASLRADLSLGESLSLGLDASGSRDDYQQSSIGRLDGRSRALGGDLAYSFSEQTQLRAYAYSERARAAQAGSQAFAQADWWARTRDRSDVGSIGINHQALGGKLGLSMDATFSRSRLDVAIDNSLTSEFPTIITRREGLRLQASYQVDPKLSWVASVLTERQTGNDWHLDGVQPTTVPNLLAFGEQTPHHNVSLLRFSVRYRY